MSQAIEFYVPATFHWKSNHRNSQPFGKLVPFPISIPRPPVAVVREQQQVATSNLDWVRTNIRSVFHSYPSRG